MVVFKNFILVTSEILSQAFLDCFQKCDLGDPQKFLSQALDPPQPVSVSKAMTLLHEVGACVIGDHTLTPLGHHLAALPVHVRIGKMMIFGALLGCLEPVVR